MQQVYVKFESVEQITEFVSVVSGFDTKFCIGSGHRSVDAKSLIGVFALDFSNPISLEYDSEDMRIRNEIMPFVCMEDIA